MAEQVGIYPQDPFLPPGAPIDARYVLQEVNPVLTNEQSLGLLTTGMLKNTVAAGVGVLSIGVPGEAPGGDYLTSVIVSEILWKYKQVFRIYPVGNAVSWDPVMSGSAVSGLGALGEWYGSPSECFYCFSTGIVSGNFTYFYWSHATGAAHMDSNMCFFMKYVTGPTINKNRTHLGISFNPSFGNVDNVPDHTYSFRYSDLVSPNWYCMTRDGVPTQHAFDTGIPVQVATVYRLEVRISGLGTQVDFLVNGVVVYTATVDLSPANQPLNFGWVMYTREAAAKRAGFNIMGFSRAGDMV